MALKIATPPAAEPITAAEAKTHLRISGSAHDTYIDTLITVARKRLEDLTGRAWITQTWNWWWPCFPNARVLRVPKGRLQSVDTFEFSNRNGDSPTAVATTVYGADTNEDGLIYLKPDQTWPSDNLWPVNPVHLQMTVGYGSASTNLPEPLIHATKLLVAHLFENREPEVIEQGFVRIEVPETITALISDYIYPVTDAGKTTQAW